MDCVFYALDKDFLRRNKVDSMNSNGGQKK